MKLLVQLLGVTVAAAVGLAIGFTGRGFTVERRIDVRETNPETTKAEKPGKRGFLGSRKLNVSPLPDDSPLATQLARDLAVSSRVARWLYWLEAVDKASVADFPRLARLANGDPTAIRLVASHWVQLDLPHLYNTLSDTRIRRGLPVDELAGVLFLEWARRDPDAAIAALQGTNSLGTREAWRFNVAGYLVEKDPERGLRALSEWGIDNFAPLMGGVTKWASADPRHAVEVVLAHPAGYTSELALNTIAREWVRVDPVAAMDFASVKSGQLPTVFANSVLKAWAGQNLSQAAEWLARGDIAARRRFSPVFVQAWAKTDPTNALAWCESNLSGDSLAETMGNIANALAQKEVAAAAEFVANMKPSAARAEAAAGVARYWFPGWRSGQPVPVAAIAWLAGLDADSIRRTLLQVEWKWSNGDPKSMAEFLTKAASNSVPPSADASVARALARQNPPDALAWASRLPGGRGLNAGRAAFNEWRHTQPELAMNWLNDLPPTDSRRNSFLNYEKQ